MDISMVDPRVINIEMSISVDVTDEPLRHGWYPHVIHIEMSILSQSFLYGIYFCQNSNHIFVVAIDDFYDMK